MVLDTEEPAVKLRRNDPRFWEEVQLEFDLVLRDLVIPKPLGFEKCFYQVQSFGREEKSGPSLLVVFCSSYLKRRQLNEQSY
jgi:hypothetical protein